MVCEIIVQEIPWQKNGQTMDYLNWYNIHGKSLSQTIIDQLVETGAMVYNQT